MGRIIVIYLILGIVSKILDAKKKQAATKGSDSQSTKGKTRPLKSQPTGDVKQTVEPVFSVKKTDTREEAPQRVFQSLESVFTESSVRQGFEQRKGFESSPVKPQVRKKASPQTKGNENKMAQAVLQGVVWQEILSKPKGLQVGFWPKK